MSEQFDIAVVGGGAAGYFAAINSALVNPELRICIFEQSKQALGKVRISGGGRCNLTHACWDPVELVTYYPRGNKELLGPFHKFACGDTMGWFEDRGLELKIEEDGRVFPVSDSSEDVISVLENERKRLGIWLKLASRVQSIEPTEGGFELQTGSGVIRASKVLLAPGGSNAMWKIAGQLGHRIVAPLPSLFTFNTKDSRLRNLAGVSVEQVELEIPGTDLRSNGPLLVTHWGLSGPAILKLSAIGARTLADIDYSFRLRINFLPGREDELLDYFEECKRSQSGKLLKNTSIMQLPRRLSAAIFGDKAERTWKSFHPAELKEIADLFSAADFKINGKSTFKEEFVTAGGVALEEVDFRTMQSRIIPGLYLAGEFLDIDALTGGFNFQAAWTTAFLAAQSMAKG